MNHAFEEYLHIFRAELPLGACFDLIERKLCIGGRRAVMYFIDGLHDGQKGQLLLNYLLAVQPETMQGLHESKDFLEAAVPFMDASVIEPQTDTFSKQDPMQCAEKGKPEEEAAAQAGTPQGGKGTRHRGGRGKGNCAHTRKGGDGARQKCARRR